MNGRSWQAGIPASKRPRVGDSPQITRNPINKSGIEESDPFDDDGFTGAELMEIEIVASQVEGRVDNNENKSFAPQFKAPLPSKTSASHNPAQGGDSLKRSRRSPGLQQEIDQLKSEIGEKNGEVRLLRDKMKDVERLLYEERQAKVAAEQAKREERLKREIALEKKVELFKDRMEFKHAELQEAQQLIRNLEMKNKELRKLASATNSGAPESQERKLRVVKAESPRASKKPLPSPDPPTQSSQSLKRRKLSVLRSSRHDLFVYPTPDEMALRRLHRYFEAHASSYNSFADAADAISRLIASRQDTESSRRQGAVAVASILEALNSEEEQDICQPSPAIASCLRALHVIMTSFASLRTEFLVDDVMATLMRFAKDSDDVTAGETMSVLIVLSEDCPGDKASTFYPIIEMVRSMLLQPSPINCHVIDLLSNFLPHSDVIEKIVTPTVDEEPSILSSVCRLCMSDDNQSAEWKRYVGKVLNFVAPLVSQYDVMLSELGCFARLYHTINMTCFALLRNNDDSDATVEKWLLPLTTCVNVYKPDPIPGVSRNPRDLLLLWRLRPYMGGRRGSPWNDEVAKFLKQEVDVMDRF